MTTRRFKVLVPRLIDSDNTNAQNLNARALLTRFNHPEIEWHCWYYHKADAAIAARANIHCQRLHHGRLWTWHAMALYQARYDAIFYPGFESYDANSLALRRLCHRRIPVISTLEGLPGDKEREAWLTARSGQQVRCFEPRSGMQWVAGHDAVHHDSSLCIAISPFLAEMGRHLYPQLPFVVLPLGTDSSLFRPDPLAQRPERPVVLGAGTLYANKRPELFLTLAAHLPQADFHWYGHGPLRESLQQQAASQGLRNLQFPGALTPAELGRQMQRATLFVLPSQSEGVPKVAQEALACGLPSVLFAHYQSPVVRNGVNGFAVQSDEELLQRVETVLQQPALRQQFSQACIGLAATLDWDRVAGEWETLIATQLHR